MKLFVLSFLFATTMFGQDISVVNGGLQNAGQDPHILLLVKNTGKKAVKNVRVSCVLSLKMNIKGNQSIIERDEVFDIPALGAGKTYEKKVSANAAVLECVKVSGTSVTQR